MSVPSQKKTNKTLRFHPITRQSISMRIGVMIASAVLLSALLPFSASALDITDKFSVDATVTGVFQHGEFSGARIDDASRGVVVTDIGINFRPTERDEFEVVVSIASGDALNTLSPFAAHPLYADDLTDALEDINGRGRDYLLRAWYKHTFALSQDTSLGLSGGIIEATDYLDDNAFANDEVSQFMNDAFVNNTLLVPPSFDVGVGGDLDIDERWSLRGVWISMKDPDRVDKPDKTYDYFGGQIGFHPQLAWGEGNYRLMAHGASDDFADPTGAHSERLFGLGLSLDQQLGDDFGAFARFGWQEDDAAIDHDTLYSGGVYVSGKRWGRASDEAGLGYAHLSGGNGDIQDTDIVEGYIKFGFSEYADLSLDIQYLDERTKGQNDPRGFVYGMRVNAYF
uniref:Porin n=1 Tax=Candidatus Kentrum sp. LPFa TaxID=2126335 RepID=A0A450WZ72_9GAMM|nr:MAG: porin [Candidatus Kentron sp. LPFa]VFK35229.1 MAG: porin [Candidatus Kentron sp. LPFa]